MNYYRMFEPYGSEASGGISWIKQNTLKGQIGLVLITLFSMIYRMSSRNVPLTRSFCYDWLVALKSLVRNFWWGYWDSTVGGQVSCLYEMNVTGQAIGSWCEVQHRAIDNSEEVSCETFPLIYLFRDLSVNQAEEKFKSKVHDGQVLWEAVNLPKSNHFNQKNNCWYQHRSLKHFIMRLILPTSEIQL